jgi:hypothetical protein
MLAGCNAHTTGDGASYATSGPIALFVLHLDSPPASWYSITHVGNSGADAAETYPFTATGNQIAQPLV